MRDTVSRVTQRPGRSVLAGCTLSTSMARASFLSMLNSAGDYPGTTIGNHVDAISHTTVARDDATASARAIRSGQAMARAMKKHGYAISSKSGGGVKPQASSWRRGGADFEHGRTSDTRTSG